MSLGAGLAAYIGVAQETTVGTAVAASRYFELESETLAAKRKIVQEQTLRAGGLYDRGAGRFTTQRDASGDITLPFPTKGAGLLLQHMLGSFATTATQVGASEAYQQVHVPGATLGKSLSIQKEVPRADGVLEPFTYPGAKITDWELSMAQSDLLKLKVTFDCWDELTAASTPASPELGAATYPTATFFQFMGGSILSGGTVSTTGGVTSVVGGTAVAAIRSATVTGKNTLKTDRYFLGSGITKAEQVENGWRAQTGSLTAEFANRDLYDQYRADEQSAVELKFLGPAIDGETNYMLDILMPACIYEDGASPQINGPDIITQTVPFTALSNDVDPAIQITYVSTDTTV